MSPEAGFTVSIEGAWGSGKTSILAMIEELLLKSGDSPSPVIVHFNPWLVGDRDSLLRQFLSKMATTVKLSNHAKEAKKVAKEIKGYLKVFDVAKLIPGAEPWASLIKSVLETTGEAVGAIGELKDQDIEKQKQRVEAALKGFSRPIIVFIDDIDRLYPAEVFEMVRIIKAVGDLPNVGYVLALDPRYVGEALTHLQVPFADSYLEKVVQTRLTIPSMSFSARQRLIKLALERQLPKEATEPHFQDAEERLIELYFSGLRELLEQPRDFVRVFNVVRPLEAELRGEVVFADLLGLAALQVKAAPVFELLKRSPRLFVGRIREDDISPEELFDEPEETIKANIEKRKAVYALCPLPDATRKIVHFLFPVVAGIESVNNFAINTTTLINGRLARPGRLLVALQFGVTSTDTSLKSIRQYVKEPALRESIADKLTSENCLEFLELLGNVAGAMSDISNTEIMSLCIDVARLIDTAPFVENARNQSIIFAPPAERIVIVSLLSALAAKLDKDSAAELGRKLVTEPMGLSLAARIIDLSFNKVNSEYLEQLVVPETDRKAVLDSFIENICCAAADGRLFKMLRPGFILSCAAHLSPQEAPRVYEAIKLADPTLDAFVMAVLSDRSDSYKGSIFSFPRKEKELATFVPFAKLKTHAKKRLKNTLTYPELAAWRSIVERKELYEKDGSEVDG